MYRQHRAPSIARVTSSPFEPRASRRASRGARVATRQQQQQQRGVGGASARHLGRVVDPHLAREQPDAEHVPRVIAVPPERRLDVRLGSRDVRRRQDAGMRDDHYHYSPARDLLSTLILIDALKTCRTKGLGALARGSCARRFDVDVGLDLDGSR